MLLALTLLATVPAAADVASVDKPKKEKRICRSAPRTGSRLPEKPICRTAAEWSALAEEARSTNEAVLKMKRAQ